MMLPDEAFPWQRQARRHDDVLQSYLALWDPDDTGGAGCTRCAQARVYGPADEPRVRCAAGYGDGLLLLRLLRPKNPRGFADARHCKEFEVSG